MAGDRATQRGHVGGDPIRVEKPTDEALAEAAEALRAGKLVVMPTETVYGLAADATNPEAVLAIFVAKGRPPENPLIVHVSEVAALDILAQQVPRYARVLIDEFWPGPLTLVMKKRPVVSDLVTAGLDTVAVRMPAHPVAQLLIGEAGVPVAAPSANRFMSLSPTRAEHVSEEIGDCAVMVLDGGPCEVGLESTVIDCTGETPKLLRPGRISRHQIEALLNVSLEESDGTRRSPGMYLRHYAPKTPVELVDSLAPGDAGLTLHEAANPNQIQMPWDAQAYGAVLYGALFDLDSRNLDKIKVQCPPETPDWEAIWDRLRKASTSSP